MKIRIAAVALVLMLATSGCSREAREVNPYEASFLDLFDTVTVIKGYAETEDEFLKITSAFRDELMEYHQLYDIYHDYEGINNLKTVNDNAGVAPVAVDPRIIDLLKFCKEIYEKTDGLVNTAMGSVLSLWHDARQAGVEDPEHAKIPRWDMLASAAQHACMEQIIIDEETNTVFLSDEQMRLDVGAIAKGYAVERVCEGAPEGLIVSVGGNVRSTGRKPNGSRWIVGVQNPQQGEPYLHTLWLDAEAVVTSGDYQRYYTVDGRRYHHIIHPKTLMPGGNWQAVSVICGDSGVADALSTAVFLMSKEEGERLLRQYAAEAIWVDRNGNEYYSTGFAEYLRT